MIRIAKFFFKVGITMLALGLLLMFALVFIAGGV